MDRRPIHARATRNAVLATDNRNVIGRARCGLINADPPDNRTARGERQRDRRINRHMQAVIDAVPHVREDFDHPARMRVDRAVGIEDRGVGGGAFGDVGAIGDADRAAASHRIPRRIHRHYGQRITVRVIKDGRFDGRIRPVRRGA